MRRKEKKRREEKGEEEERNKLEAKSTKEPVVKRFNHVLFGGGKRKGGEKSIRITEEGKERKEGKGSLLVLFSTHFLFPFLCDKAYPWDVCKKSSSFWKKH